jgi:hypothetical protein
MTAEKGWGKAGRGENSGHAFVMFGGGGEITDQINGSQVGAVEIKVYD